MEELKPRSEQTGRFKARHGMYGTKLYHIWNGMTGRCMNPNNKDYPNYGGRGIRVCEEWKTPELFFGWAFLSGYNVDLTLDRIDYNQGYFPENCRWISIDAQQRNKRNNHILEYKGESHCIAEWSEIVGIPKQTILSRIRRGWSTEKALTVEAWNRRVE